MENTKEKYFKFLDELRISGETNMFVAAPYVSAKFNLPIKESREILTEWMTSFGERTQLLNE